MSLLQKEKESVHNLVKPSEGKLAEKQAAEVSCILVLSLRLPSKPSGLTYL